MPHINPDIVITSLKKIDFKIQGNIKFDISMISPLVITDQNIGFSIAIDKKYKDNINFNELTNLCKEVIAEVYPQAKVSVVYTFEKKYTEEKAEKPKKNIPNIKKIIAIASCKGGVGKSTVTANLAIALSTENLKVGILDADIYGPSIPKIFGIESEIPIIEDGKIVPIEKEGIRILSVGNIVPESSAGVWRGPMTTKILYQLLEQTKWGDLDILLIDMPPGTGDIYLSIFENYKVNGTILITTPSDIAIIDLKKSISMFEKFNISIIGLIENMSYLIDSSSGEKLYIFGKEGGKKIAAEKNIELLGEVPIDSSIRENADFGRVSRNSLNNIYLFIIKKIIKIIF